MGRDKFKNPFVWKDEIEEPMSSDKLKIGLWGSKMIKIVQNGAMEKVDGSWFFWPDFRLFWPKSDLYEFIEKQAPQKALCLGPDPPPGARSKFIDFLPFFMILGPSIEPEKPSVKSASTPYPPQKVNFIANLSIFNISRPNFTLWLNISCLCCIFGIVFFSFAQTWMSFADIRLTYFTLVFLDFWLSLSFLWFA
jgi:hypothetical protein